MAICPHCQTTTQVALDPCPTGDGYYCVDESDYNANRDEELLGVAVGGRFVVQALLGTGSMAEVYRTHQLEVDRTVALKVFRTDELLDPDVSGGDRGDALETSRSRFVQEARVLGKLAHPNCVTLFDFGTAADGRYLYIAMEFVGGISLRGAINRGLKLDAIYEIATQILMALREAHNIGIVHRDLKPENIILSFKYADDEPVVKVVDFGIAKLLGRENAAARTNFGTLFGTPAYMSPEQCRGAVDEVGPHSDIYSLGCMLYEMVCGKLPYESQVPMEMIRMHVNDPAPAVKARPGLAISAEFEAFIQRCMSKEPQDRFADARAALSALTDVIGVDGAPTTTARRKALSGGVPRGRVVVPGNRISGAQLDAPQHTPTPTMDGDPGVIVVASEIKAPPQGGPGVLETHDERATPGPEPKPQRRGSFAVALLVLSFVFLLTSCLLLFVFIWKAAA